MPTKESAARSSAANQTKPRNLTNGEGASDQLDFATSIEEYPATVQRQPFMPSDDVILQNAGIARANIAASKEHPNGTTDGQWSSRHKDMTVMQQHCLYWDTDEDGIIWPQDTYLGCRAWGWAIPLAAFAAFVIHFNLSYGTVPGLLPDPLFRIYLQNIHKDKHGSDSMTYDNEGRFKPQNFEDIFSKYDQGDKGGLTLGDLFQFWNGQRMAFDFFGWSATFLEWVAVYLLLWPEDGMMKKDEIRRIYDGSIFFKKAEEHAKRKGTTPSDVFSSEAARSKKSS